MRIFVIVIILTAGVGLCWQWQDAQTTEKEHLAEMQLVQQRITELEEQSRQRNELMAFLAWRARLIGEEVTVEEVRKSLSTISEPSLEVVLEQLRSLGGLPADNELKIQPGLYPKDPVRLNKLIDEQKQRVDALRKQYPHNAWPGHGSLGYFSHPKVIAERQILYALYAYKNAPNADGDQATASLETQLALTVAQSLISYRNCYDDWSKIVEINSDELVPEKIILGVPPKADQ